VSVVPPDPLDVVSEHRQLVEALATGDAEAASSALAAHLTRPGAVSGVDAGG